MVAKNTTHSSINTTQEDRPRQLPASPSARATQKFFFKKQVQSFDQVSRRRNAAPRQGSTAAHVDTLSKQLIKQKENDDPMTAASGKPSWEETDYKRMLVSMVFDFKKRSRSRGRQVITQNHSQLNITQVAAKSLNQSELEIQQQPNLLN